MFAPDDKSRRIAFQDSRLPPERALDRHRATPLYLIRQLSAIREPWVTIFAEINRAAEPGRKPLREERRIQDPNTAESASPSSSRARVSARGARRKPGSLRAASP